MNESIGILDILSNMDFEDHFIETDFMVTNINTFNIQPINSENELLPATVSERLIEFGYCEIDHGLALDRAKTLSPGDIQAIDDWHKFLGTYFPCSSQDQKNRKNLDEVAENIILCARKYGHMRRTNAPYALIDTRRGELYIKNGRCYNQFTSLLAVDNFFMPKIHDKGNIYCIKRLAHRADHIFIVHARCHQKLEDYEDTSKLRIDIQNVLRRSNPEPLLSHTETVQKELKIQLKNAHSEIIEKVVKHIFFDNKLLGDIYLGVSFNQTDDGKTEVRIGSLRESTLRKAAQTKTTVSYEAFCENVDQEIAQALSFSKEHLKNFVNSFFMLADEDETPYLSSVEAYFRTLQIHPVSDSEYISYVNSITGNQRDFKRNYHKWLMQSQIASTQN